MKIAVLVAPAVHPVSGRPCAGAADLAALALAQMFSARQIDVIHAGPSSEQDLADYLAQGADNIKLLSLPEDSDCSAALAAVLVDYSLILCGNRSGGGNASAMLPYLLAEQLKRPLLPDVLSLKQHDQQLHALQFQPKGVRRSLQANLPLIASVNPRAASGAGWAYARLSQARLQAQTAQAPRLAPLRLEPVRRPRALSAANKISGHLRLQGAIAASENRGGVVVKQGSSVEKAQVVLDYLRQHQLIDF